MQAPAGKNAWRRQETMMKDLQNSRPALPFATEMPIPLTAWWSGFDYAFGYQIKLLQQFWGFSPRD